LDNRLAQTLDRGRQFSPEVRNLLADFVIQWMELQRGLAAGS
jgi:hypothetical protein